MSYDETEDRATTPTESESAPQAEGEGEFDGAFGEPGPSKQSPKQLAVLGGLLLVAAVVIWFMYFRGGPQSAEAGMAPNDAGGQIKKFLDSGNIDLMVQTLKNTDKIVRKFRTYPEKTQVPLADLRSNPFRELPPKVETAAPVSDDAAAKEAELHKQAQDAAADLHLQSIMRGSGSRLCMINNTLYQEGQRVGVFTITKIGAGTVVVEAGKYRFQLNMQN